MAYQLRNKRNYFSYLRTVFQDDHFIKHSNFWLGYLFVFQILKSSLFILSFFYLIILISFFLRRFISIIYQIIIIDFPSQDDILIWYSFTFVNIGKSPCLNIFNTYISNLISIVSSRYFNFDRYSSSSSIKNIKHKTSNFTIGFIDFSLI